MNNPRKQLVWFITGASSGVGKSIAQAALQRGDKVIATARAQSFDKLGDLEGLGASIMILDVCSSPESLVETAQMAIEVYGHVDVVVNNAGYGLVGVLEDSTPEETFAQMNTNVFGALNVARAFLPHMRQRKTGTILWIGSVAGWVGAQYSSLYSASKWAIRAISESLHLEISPVGLRSICVNLGYFRTSFLSGLQRSVSKSNAADYQSIIDQVEAGIQAYDGHQPGDPNKAARILTELIHGDGPFAEVALEELPTTLTLGADAYEVIKNRLAEDAKDLERWEGVSKSCDIETSQ